MFEASARRIRLLGFGARTTAVPLGYAEPLELRLLLQSRDVEISATHGDADAERLEERDHRACMMGESKLNDSMDSLAEVGLSVFDIYNLVSLYALGFAAECHTDRLSAVVEAHQRRAREALDDRVRQPDPLVAAL